MNWQEVQLAMEACVKNMAPIKVKCFSWLIVRRARLTHEVLLGKKNTSSIEMFSIISRRSRKYNHLYVHCEVTTISFAQESWTMPEHSTND